MKNLVSFKLFESDNKEELHSIYMECSDILLELKDEGFKVNIMIGELPNHWLLINISKLDLFKPEDIEWYIERISDYLKSLNFKQMKTDDNVNSYPNIGKSQVYNPVNFSIDHIKYVTTLQFVRYDDIKESKKEEYQPIVSDIKYDLDDMLIDLKDEGYRVNIIINNWLRNELTNDNQTVNWINIQIGKEGDWNLTNIEDYLIRVIEFLSSKSLYPFFDPVSQNNLKTILKLKNIDIYQNRISKVPGTTNTWSYDITFTTQKALKLK